MVVTFLNGAKRHGCSAIQQLSSSHDSEIDNILHYAKLKRLEGKDVVRDMGRKYRTEGYVLSELIEQLKERDQEIGLSYEEDEYDER